MPFLEKFRDPVIGRGLLEKVLERARAVREKLGRPAVFMEVCGTHTVAISRAGLRSILGEYLELRSGPGCPVCVTDCADIDRMVAFASLPGVTVGTFGDMMRVPGSRTSLERQRAAGADVRVFYSPRDAVAYAAEHPEREMVFLGVGFETTAPGVAAAIAEARTRGVKNFSVFSTHKVVPPAMRAIIADPELRIDGFILPGHVTTIIGRRSFDFIAAEYGLPAVVAGFETLDIIDAVYHLLGQMLAGEARVENGYTRVVREEGNLRAQAQMAELFEVGDASWRGFGVIPQSGLEIRAAYRDFDAAARFEVKIEPPRLPKGCACGDLLKGKLTPRDCRLFGTACTPTHPVGPCMVSSEGACAAYYQYERHK
ncbi:MAG: Hydrogenase expression/formation protein HypD [Clostridia bacterium 62_21]|nr:MAG: Hydrogenase expression/formation protein HypD [Clostridia bacterium 62_21]HAG06837.1 hydrogenase formation protein HypD [Peptococcaceae bacterium]